ncbi:hypothetical protein [Xanthomonas euvesicatoria]|uniref:hypothetical protein n=1 Tax=Xanthomonas euvesicatoria TaxID=456327 RepID=UPI00080E0059|nr:hypothetical protein [Xanthomonas euvesicatoria]MCC8799089.1 hypothetical protein [Xanthomonas euvesicatoria pv. euvesicatoria]MCC8807694.1 hypothetical protein [Xanthomonas euvesicatoria pv. euvesicatoria]MCC8816139.1 hypothetical protein [Xanthomonas euvesicatoria pv. euvesicatoria]
MVGVKRLLDDLCRSRRSSWIIEQICPDLLNAAHSALDGDGFLAAVVPFVGDEGAETPALVPVDSMIGESWKWRECTSSWRSADELESYLTAPERAFRSDPDASLSTYLDRLGLAVAFEGKNRVRFLHDRGVEYMPSAVALASYPAPERLKIFHVRTPRGNTAWCVLDDRWLEPLMLPAVSHAILDPYGVKTSYRWPSSWPAIAAVEEALERNTGVRPHDPVDLEQLRDWQTEMEKQGEWITSSVLALSIHRLRWRPVLIGFISTLVAALISDRMPGPYAAQVSWALSGAAMGFAVAWCAPLLRARRKHVT